MPTITATVHQVLRYFFVGALAVAFVATPPGEGWSVRFESSLTHWHETKADAAIALAILIWGSLIYAAHRVILYPWIFRFFILPVVGEQPPRRRWRDWCPYGKADSGELYLEKLGAGLPERDRERFVGWASEIHLCYLATEIALVTLVGALSIGMGAGHPCAARSRRRLGSAGSFGARGSGKEPGAGAEIAVPKEPAPRRNRR